MHQPFSFALLLFDRMDLAIVGAGAAGLAAAYALRSTPIRVTVFEKSRGLGGRAATRRHVTDTGTFAYDHGAQYIRPERTSPAYDLLATHLPTDGLVDLARPVVPFDGTGRLRPDLRRPDDGPMWTYAEGVADLGRRLAEAAAVTLYRATRIAHLTRHADGWTLHATDGAAFGPFDAVLLTPPAPQTADLLAASTFDADLRDRLVAALRMATYRQQTALVLAYDRVLPRPADAYAFVDVEARFPVAWLAFESDKPGRAPTGWSLLVAQMSPAWSRAHHVNERDMLVRAALPEVSRVLGSVWLGRPAWADGQRWRYALPDTPADATTLGEGADLGLYFAGDYVAGKGRVHLALESGLAVAATLRQQMG